MCSNASQIAMADTPIALSLGVLAGAFSAGPWISGAVFSMSVTTVLLIRWNAVPVPDFTTPGVLSILANLALARLGMVSSPVRACIFDRGARALPARALATERRSVRHMNERQFRGGGQAGQNVVYWVNSRHRFRQLGSVALPAAIVLFASRDGGDGGVYAVAVP